MSKLSDMVEEEARRAEAEPEPEPGEPEPGEPKPGEPEPGEPEPSMQAALERFERENTRHEKALAKIMGEDFEAFEACPVCIGVGFRPALPFVHDPHLARCETCGGQGFMATGSLREDRAVRECLECGGNGYVTKAEPALSAIPPEQRRPLYDAYTGLPLTPEQVENGAASQSAWAPGYVPPGQAAPQASVGA